ncbi:hypothetical protein C823_001238 [Eubacterium plexicaudatum ASF492]|nr:hypothetical protein C823_001238 [Eubacterium plexicaudatum ASF492]
MLDETHLSAGNGSKELTVEKNQIKTVLLKRNAG